MESLHYRVPARATRAGRTYAVVITRGASTYCAVVPDLPGCAAVCRTRVDVERVIQRSIASHISALEEQGLPVPEPRSTVVMIPID
ncbi:MAG TPA: type II toxin-antitoxin system HicB family antitoxin [Vicinamibacterales bacterium]|nr:type II toxin-antitoxin system HicB family antitoxin [Vicinamibacterales bacterium]